MQSPEDAQKIAEALVERGMRAGATAADALYAAERSSSVNVRLGQLEGVGRSEGEEIGLRLFVGQRSATVSSSDLSDDALAVLVERCIAMAREAPEDAYAGLAPTELLQQGEAPAIDSFDSREPDPGELRGRALEAESAALAIDGVTNSSGDVVAYDASVDVTGKVTSTLRLVAAARYVDASQTLTVHYGSTSAPSWGRDRRTSCCLCMRWSSQSCSESSCPLPTRSW